ncbi:MAG: hypothetical protein VX899_10720 [Myxococcota bacterium]|nr:hypothetical protein [Myxococcota bacterium]
MTRLLMLVLALSTLAFAGDREQAELERYSEDLATLSERQAWEGVERTYEKIMELAGVDIPREVHMQGAHAARATGDMSAVLERLERAQEVEKDDETAQWINEINQSYSRVELIVPKGVVLVPEMMPFAPDQRLQVEKAAQALKDEGQFSGLLPVGNYTLGGVGFEVVAGITAKVELSGRELRKQ